MGCYTYIYAPYPWFAVGEAKTLVFVGYCTRTPSSFFGSVWGGEVLLRGCWLHFEATPVSRTSLVCHRHFLRPLEARSGLGMDALVTVCSWNTNGILVWRYSVASKDALRINCVFFGKMSPKKGPSILLKGSRFCVSLWRRCMCISCISCAATRLASKSDGNPGALRVYLLYTRNPT